MSNNDLEVVNPSVVAADTPQFTTAEYGHIPASERCSICTNFISGEYYRINDQMACSQCVAEAEKGQPTDSHAAFVRAVVFGSGAAVLGLILYATFTIVTNWYLGYIALGVGWLVGKAMMKGSNGKGGRRYQIAAVLLTYAAISVAVVPIQIAHVIKHRHEMAESHKLAAATADHATTDNAGVPTAPQSQPTPPHFKPLGALLLYGLASPFLELKHPANGVIGLIILFIGLRIAFRMTGAKLLYVDGPYAVTA